MPKGLNDIKIPEKSFDEVSNEAQKEFQQNYEKLKNMSLSETMKSSIQQIAKNYEALKNSKLPEFGEAMKKASEEMNKNLEKLHDVDFSGINDAKDITAMLDKFKGYQSVMEQFNEKVSQLQDEYGVNIQNIMQQNQEVWEKLKNLPAGEIPAEEIPELPSLDENDINIEGLERAKQKYEDKMKDFEERNKDLLEAPGFPFDSFEEMASQVSQVELLARTIFAEQSRIKNGAQEAVATVIINRLKNNKQLQDILKPSIFSSLKGEGDNKNAIKPDVNSQAWQNALNLARKIINEEYADILNEIGNATEFRSQGFFKSKLVIEKDTEGNETFKFDGNPVTNIHYIGGNAFFEYVKIKKTEKIKRK